MKDLETQQRARPFDLSPKLLEKLLVLLKKLQFSKTNALYILLLYSKYVEWEARIGAKKGPIQIVEENELKDFPD